MEHRIWADVISPFADNAPTSLTSGRMCPIESPTRPLSAVLIEVFEEIPDPRVERTRLHRLADILLLSLAAFCCGAAGFEDIEDWALDEGEERLREAFGVRLDHGIPHHDTFARVLRRLDPTTLEAALHQVRRALIPVQGPPDHVAIDGKELRGSHNALHGSGAIMLLSAFATDWDLVLGQRKIDAKSNEIPAAVEVLSQIAIKGATVTADALHCQRETARVIREREADYLLAVKDNQPTLHQALISLFETNRSDKRLPMTHAKTLGKDHGRIEERDGFLIRVSDWLPAGDPFLLLWKDLTSVFCLIDKRTWTHRGEYKTCTYTRYFISSSSRTVKQHMEYARSHWKIENNLHWLMDVTFGEDSSRVRTGHEAENLATLRRTAAFLLKQSTPDAKHRNADKMSIRRRKKIAGWNLSYLLRTLKI